MYPTGVHGPAAPVSDRTRPIARDIEWNRLIKEMPVREYCDWVLAGRPGFSDMAPHRIRAWQKERAR
jgi:hypothetical protein